MSRTRHVMGIVFVTLLLDLAGFSIIFPLYPSLLEYYMETGHDSGLLTAVLAGIDWFAHVTGAGAGRQVVLFGGLLGSLYSLLQFVFTPLLGTLSDRYGRRPILLFSIGGIVVSYALWCVSGRFELLIVSRLIAGIMSANISTASAAIADVTTGKGRSKGMALVGAAIGLGFILGPAIGGIFSEVNLLDAHPEWARFGVNPFTVPAAAALVLSLANWIWVFLRFEETLGLQQSAVPGVRRTVNPLRLFKAERYPGVTGANVAYFVYLTAFSGMEFTLAFLAAERFGYSPREISYMFLFTGITLALMQGSYVQMRSGVIGPRRMALHGLVLVIPGLLLIGFSHGWLTLYAGLLVLALGTSQVLPCLTTLVSLYTPPFDQGRVLGVFRSLGALARAVGPILACLLYWRLGSTSVYVIAAAAVAVPLYLAYGLPVPASEPDSDA